MYVSGVSAEEGSVDAVVHRCGVVAVVYVRGVGVLCERCRCCAVCGRFTCCGALGAVYVLGSTGAVLLVYLHGVGVLTGDAQRANATTHPKP